MCLIETFSDDGDMFADLDMAAERLHLGEYWIELPGMHPICLPHDVIKDENLWDYIVPDGTILRQIER